MSAKKFDPEEVVATLAGRGVQYLLIGGLAANARFSPYLTVDIDICPSADVENLGKLANALRELRARRVTDLEPEGAKVEITPDYLAKGNEFAFATPYGRFDIIFVPLGTRGFADLKRDATNEEVFGYQVLVASTIDIIRMKDARGMPRDRLVVNVLREILDREDDEKRP